ncbi:MAG: ABC transporter ATP-binding protein [Clostridia bacterium]|nr:ABC transporter ATP-binding protein [Clostridia bacterium]
MADKTKREKQSVQKIISNVLYMLKFAAKFTPSYIFGMVTEGVVWGIIHSCTSVIFVKMLFDSLEVGNFRNTAGVIGLMAAFSLVTYLFHVWYWNIFNPMIRKKLNVRMQEVLFEKARSMDLECYDNPEFYNDFVWATRESDGRVASILENIGKLINRLVATFTIIGVLLTIDFLMVLAILLLSAGASLFRLWRQRIQFNRQQEEVAVNRHRGYISRVFSLPDYAKELRISHVSDLLTDEYDKILTQKKDIIHRYGLKGMQINALEGALHNLFGECGITILLIVRLFTGVIALGDFAAGINSIWKLYWQINSLTEFLIQYPEHSLYVDKFRKFMNYEPKVTGGDKTVPSLQEIQFKNVCFQYAGTEKESLTDVNLTIRRGEKIAIVGYNGAGKSTFIKLLLHLYDATSGEIVWNGTDIRKLNLDEYRKNMVALFQDYQIFAATLAENVLADTYTSDMEHTVIEALQEATFTERLQTMPKGIQTPLTKEFAEDGINLSGGESQKVAIARAFAQAKLRNSDVIVLDEPSSALDPMAEYELNKTILECTEDKTVIFISHRLSTTRMADRIYMFDDGRLIECGSHNELMALNGKYAEMFLMQAEKYTASIA